MQSEVNAVPMAPVAPDIITLFIFNDVCPFCSKLKLAIRIYLTKPYFSGILITEKGTALNKLNRRFALVNRL